MSPRKLERYFDCDYLTKKEISDPGAMYGRLYLATRLLAAACMLRHETKLGRSRESAGQIAYRRLIGAAVYILEEEPTLRRFATVVRRLFKFKNDFTDEFDWLGNQMELIDDWKAGTGRRQRSSLEDIV
jgi:hypothetical protein